MADVVQYRLERMVGELEDLERRDLFSRQEIAEIVKQRRKFEYRLKRPCPLKQDFLDYIDYEKRLDSLRHLRKKMAADKLKNKGNKRARKSASDFAGISRIINIYRLAVMRYKGDIDLWFQYLEYCRAHKNGRLKKVLSQVIKYHPKVPGVWIYAAAWEFDQNLNVSAARALMHNGLRVCPASEDLWVEYLRMELTYLNKLKARKLALGEDGGTLIRDHANDDEKHWRDENKELFVSLSDKEFNDLLHVPEESEEKVDVFQEQGIGFLQTIYSGAVKALPSSLGLRKKFLEIMEGADLAHSVEMRNLILKDMKCNFETKPEYWDWLARLETLDPLNNEEKGEEAIPSKLHKAVQIYEEALRTAPSSMMFDLYVKFLMDHIILRGAKFQILTLLSSFGNTLDAFSYLMGVFERAETMGCLTADLACQHVLICLQSGRLNEARKLADKLCKGNLLDSVKLWILRVSIEMRRVAIKSPFPSKGDLQFVLELLRPVLVKVPISKAEDLWLMALKFFANDPRCFEKLVGISLGSLAKEGGSNGGFSLSSMIVNYVFQRDGIGQAREMYKRFLGLPRPGLAAYRSFIEMELDVASLGGDPESLLNARKLFDSAVATYDQDVGLWRDFYAMEIKMGTSETSTGVYWRAQKTLKDVSELRVSCFSS